MTRFAHYLGWLVSWFRMGRDGWDYDQAVAARLFAKQQMELNKKAAADAHNRELGVSGQMAQNAAQSRHN